MKRPGLLGFAVLGVACTLPVAAPPDDPTLDAPVNVCPDHPCSEYVQAGASPQCNGGVCLVAAPDTGLVLVVSLSDDSFFAPGQSFAVRLSDLFNASTPTSICSLQGTSTEARPCVRLPDYAIVSGAYVASPAEAKALDWNLGNPTQNTSLPVHVTYRPLWPPDNAGGAVDADSVGLPLLPLTASPIVDPLAPPGPNAGPSNAFKTGIQPALYERTISPDPPFDVAFPPDVSRVTALVGSFGEFYPVNHDVTVQTEGTPVIPTFDLSRVEGLGDWTAYLRDAKTKRRLSPVAALSGTKTSNVVLPTNHHPADGDALTGAELVMVPPADQPIATGVFAPQGGTFSRAIEYVPLPAPVALSGSITAADGQTPVEADLVFEAQGIYELGATQPNTANFEYTGRASARIDATSAASVWSAVLPAGQYRLTVRPLDAGQGVTVVQPFQVDPSSSPITGKDVALAPQQAVSAVVRASDGRPFAGATVKALPISCMLGHSDACLPRRAETTTAMDGSFTMMLDQGGYVLRVEPPAGTRFPWVLSPSVQVTPQPVLLDDITVDAPVYAGLVLHDIHDDPIVGAVVRVYELPATGPALEVGRAITDSLGHYDVFLSPSAQ